MMVTMWYELFLETVSLPEYDETVAQKKKNDRKILRALQFPVYLCLSILS